MLFLVDFPVTPVTPKLMTLSDLEWLFNVKFCFGPACRVSETAAFRDNCVNTNKDTRMLSAAKL